MVCAPPGYGKTLLLADWVRTTGDARTAWVSLDSGDNDADQFWSAVLSAICECECVPADSLLRELVPWAESDGAGFLAEVVDAFDTLPGRLCLVLDDVHEVVGQETLHGIATLIRHQPRKLRLVLASRSDPPLPLARLRAQGRLAEIRAARLRFSEEEAAELMRTADVALDRDQLRRLVEQTDGWAAGLRLAARSLREVSDRDAFLADFASNDRAVADYLVGEVLSRLTNETRRFLRAVSVCDEVTPLLAEVLSGRDDAGVLLDALERESALVMGIGTDRPWYRMHPLLRAYLRADLDRQRPELAADLHGVAAAWFASEEQLHEALDHAGQTENTNIVVEMLRRFAVELLMKGDYHIVRRGLGILGEDYVAKDPWLGLIAALAFVEMGELAAAQSGLSTSRAAWPAHGGRDLETLQRLVTSTHALVCGPPPTSASLAGQAVGRSREGTGVEAWARSVLGCSLLHAGDHDGARRELETAERLARDRGFDYLVTHCLTALGAVSALDGDYEAMEAACSESITMARERGWQGSPLTAASHVMLGFASLLQLDPAGASNHSTQAARVVDKDSQPRLHFMIGLLKGAARFDEGRRSTGLQLMQYARKELADITLLPELVAAAALIEHRAAVLLAQDAVAREITGWVQARVGTTAELSLMTAWTQFARGDHVSARDALRYVLDDPRSVVAPLTRLEGRLVETALAIRAGERTKARRSLGAALVIAEQAAVIRPFWQAEPSVRQLLVDQLGGFGRSELFAIRVHRALSKLDGGPADGLLTGREHVVLAQLTSQQSLDEVALGLSVSVNTVKTHVRAIYAKLGVNNRRAAVVAARELGLT
jgi:LuxR family maltose regulon positive regulatory protein